MMIREQFEISLTVEILTPLSLKTLSHAASVRSKSLLRLLHDIYTVCLYDVLMLRLLVHRRFFNFCITSRVSFCFWVSFVFNMQPNCCRQLYYMAFYDKLLGKRWCTCKTF